jgi:hypothetical protein
MDITPTNDASLVESNQCVNMTPKEDAPLTESDSDIKITTNPIVTSNFPCVKKSIDHFNNLAVRKDASVQNWLNEKDKASSASSCASNPVVVIERGAYLNTYQTPDTEQVSEVARVEPSVDGDQTSQSSASNSKDDAAYSNAHKETESVDVEASAVSRNSSSQSNAANSGDLALIEDNEANLSANQSSEAEKVNEMARVEPSLYRNLNCGDLVGARNSKEHVNSGSCGQLNVARAESPSSLSSSNLIPLNFDEVAECNDMEASMNAEQRAKADKAQQKPQVETADEVYFKAFLEKAEEKEQFKNEKRKELRDLDNL